VNRDGQPLLGLRLTLATAAQAVRLTLDGSEDLRTWTPCPVLLEPLADLGSGVLRVQLLANQALSSSRPLFLRLGAEFTSYGQIITSPNRARANQQRRDQWDYTHCGHAGHPADGTGGGRAAAAYPGPQTFTISCTPIVQS